MRVEHGDARDAEEKERHERGPERAREPERAHVDRHQRAAPPAQRVYRPGEGLLARARLANESIST